MTVSQAIERLQKILAKHGDVLIQSDCPYCGKVFNPGVAVVAKLGELSQP